MVLTPAAAQGMRVCARHVSTQVTAWLVSSAVSIALSVLILQPAKALLGGLLASVLTVAATASALAVVAVTTEMVALN